MTPRLVNEMIGGRLGRVLLLIAAAAGAASLAASRAGAVMAPVVVQHARADIDGDGRLGPVKVVQTGADRWRLQVRPEGRVLSAAIPRGAGLEAPTLVKAGNVNARPGAELFVVTRYWANVYSGVSIYSYLNGQLRRIKTLPFDVGSQSTYTLACVNRGGRHFVLQRFFYAGVHETHEVDTTYAWKGGTLHLYARSKPHQAAHAPAPTVACGHRPMS